MFSVEECCRLVHAFQVRCRADMPTDGLVDGQRPQADAISVLAVSGVVSCMEIRSHLPDGGHSNRSRKQAVDGGQQAVCIRRGFQVQVGHLSAGVHAGVRAAGADDGDRSAESRLQGRLYGTLNGGMVGLDLPTVPIRSEIFDIESIGGHFSGKTYLEGDASAR